MGIAKWMGEAKAKGKLVDVERHIAKILAKEEPLNASQTTSRLKAWEE